MHQPRPLACLLIAVVLSNRSDLRPEHIRAQQHRLVRELVGHAGNKAILCTRDPERVCVRPILGPRHCVPQGLLRSGGAVGGQWRVPPGGAARVDGDHVRRAGGVSGGVMWCNVM
jgi:hypothetical protein